MSQLTRIAAGLFLSIHNSLGFSFVYSYFTTIQFFAIHCKNLFLKHGLNINVPKSENGVIN